MDISSVATKSLVASVALLGGAVAAAMSIGTASATAGGTSDDFNGNTKTCRQAYPHWDNPDYLDVWFGRDGDDNPICQAQVRGSDNPITLCWPDGAAVIVVVDTTER